MDKLKSSGNPNPKNKFKKGQSGNKKGRPPKGTSFAEITKEYMEEIVNMGDGTKKRRKELLVAQTFKLMLQGNPAALNMMWNRHDGLQKQAIELETPVSKESKALNKNLEKLLNKTRKKYVKAPKNKTKKG